MKKNVGLTYVSEFSFPPEQGFTGSAGKSKVKGYMRGGHVKQKDPVKAAAQKHRAPGPGAARGGHMKEDYSHGGTVGVTTKRGPKSKRPKNTMTKAARGGSMHDKLRKEGESMGYAYGGQVKPRDTSSEFKMTSKAQDSMDHGTYGKGQYANEAEKEAGGRKKLLPAFKKGGGVHRVRPRGEKKMPKNVKAKGGLAKYAEGGNISVRDVPGSGAARRNMGKLKDRERRVRSTVDEAVSAARSSYSGASGKPSRMSHDSPPAKKQGPRKIYREDKGGVPTFTDVPKVGNKRVGKRGAAR